MKKDQKLVQVFLRPPIVAVLGHVDHGKTSLLDYIRKTNVTASEHGGITQHIGAYQVTVEPKSKNEDPKIITFIDTPGHEAFIKMRSRGANVADIAILVVAADDSVKPQTVESIRVIEAAGIPMIVAANKIDLPSANIEKIKKDLAKSGVQVEGFGGDVPLVQISAKTGKGVGELLEMVLLVAEVKNVPKPDEGDGSRGVVIETRVDKGKGMVATLVVTKGDLAVKDSLYDGTKLLAKIRALFNEFGKPVTGAQAGAPVEVLGFTMLPTVGTKLSTVPVVIEGNAVSTQNKPAGTTMPDFLQPINPDESDKLKMLLKADTAGSLEAISEALPAGVEVVASSIGDITEADILQAKATGAVILGFQVKCRGSVVKLAETEKVIYRTYTIIYKLLEELDEVIEGMKSASVGERELGQAQIVAEFPFDNQKVAGTKVVTGRLVRGDTVKIMRGDTEIGRGKIKSLRIGKEDAGKVTGGSECGVLFDRKLDFIPGDGIIAFTTG